MGDKATVEAVQTATVSGERLDLDDLRDLVKKTEGWPGSTPVFPSQTVSGQRDEFVNRKIVVQGRTL